MPSISSVLLLSLLLTLMVQTAWSLLSCHAQVRRAQEAVINSRPFTENLVKVTCSHAIAKPCTHYRMQPYALLHTHQ